MRVSLAVMNKPETRVRRKSVDGRVLGHESVSSTSMTGYAVCSRAVTAVVYGDL